MAHNDYYDKSNNYENWVDKLIYTHKQKLQNFRNNGKVFDVESQSPRINKETNLIKYTGSSGDNLNNLKQNRLEKLIDSLVEENAELRLKLQDKVKTIESLKNNNLYSEKESKSNYTEFFEREKDLVETLKVLDFQNKKSNEKINELKFELNKKTKDLDIALSLNENVLNMNMNSSRSKKDNFNFNNEDDVNFLCMKYEKIIEIFLVFFNKYEITKDLNILIKSFNYESIRNKLNEFDNYLKNNITENKFDFSLNASPKYKNNEIKFSDKLCKNESTLRSRNGLAETSNEQNGTEESNKNNKNSSNVCIGESDIFLKLDQRLRDLETNVSSLISDKDKSLGKTKSQNSLASNIKKIKINAVTNKSADKKNNISTTFGSSKLNTTRSIKKIII